MTSLTLPQSLTTIKTAALLGSGIAQLYVPASVTAIYPRVSSTTQLIIDPDNPVYKNQDGMLLSKDGLRLVDCLDCQGDIQIPEGIEIICASAFYGRKGITSVTLPETVKIIEEYAFADCPDLTSVSLSEGLTAIGDWAFSDCIALTRFHASGPLCLLGNGVFENCSGLTTVFLPQGLTEIPESLFSGCSSLREVLLPDSLQTIGNSAFSQCAALETISLPNSLQAVGAYAFADSGLQTIVLPEQVTALSSGVFLACKQLSSVSLPQGISQIPFDVFSGCDNLEEIYYDGPELSWSSIGQNLRLTDVTIRFATPNPEITVAPMEIVTEETPPKGISAGSVAIITVLMAVGILIAVTLYKKQRKQNMDL